MDTMSRETEEYIPGVCNIDAKGRRMRATVGKIGLAITIILWVVLFYVESSFYWNILLLLFALAGFIGFWQAHFSFCVADAGKQQYEIGGKTEKITNQEHIAKDKKKAAKIYVYAVGSAFLLIIVLVILRLVIENIWS